MSANHSVVVSCKPVKKVFCKVMKKEGSWLPVPVSLLVGWKVVDVCLVALSVYWSKVVDVCLVALSVYWSKVVDVCLVALSVYWSKVVDVCLVTLGVYWSK